MKQKYPTDDEKPWDRIPGESVRDFARFEKYRMCGAGRSIGDAYRAMTGRTGRALNSWYELANRNRWRERADAWDMVTIEQERKEFEIARKKSRESRIKVLEEFLDRMIEISTVLDPKTARWSDITDAIATITKRLREEYGEPATNQAEVSIAVGAGVQFVAQMPAPAESLEEWAKQVKASTR